MSVTSASELRWELHLTSLGSSPWSNAAVHDRHIRAWTMEAYGPVREVLTLTDVAEPTPGPGQYLLQV
jgi:hypothetical protein